MEDKEVTAKLLEHEQRLDQIERESRRQIEPVNSRQVEAQQAVSGLIEKVAEATKVPAEQVRSVLNHLGLQGLQENLAASVQPRRVVDGGRLFVSLAGYRQILMA